MGTTLARQVKTRVAEALRRASAVPSASETPSAVAALQRSVGNSVVRAALAGAQVGGFGPVVRAAVMGQAAGIAPTVPGEAPNSVMLAILRQVRASGGGGFHLPAGTGNALPDGVRARMEAAFGHDFEHVRIHSDAPAAHAAAAIDAYAFTVGSDIYFGQGQFAPGTRTGDRLLVHELTHVKQDDEGRLSGKHGVSSPTDSTEREAYAAEREIGAVLERGPETPSEETGTAGHAAETAGSTGAADAPAPSEGTASGRSEARATNTSTYAGGPPTLRDATAAQAAPRTGPTTSEDALLGPLPTVADARAQAPCPVPSIPPTPIPVLPTG
ncbi:MAG: DUF4157 domain-containing protein, partial [Myxococcota bacterium]